MQTVKKIKSVYSKAPVELDERLLACRKGKGDGVVVGVLIAVPAAVLEMANKLEYLKYLRTSGAATTGVPSAAMAVQTGLNCLASLTSSLMRRDWSLQARVRILVLALALVLCMVQAIAAIIQTG